MNAQIVATIVSAFTIELTVVALHLQTMTRIDRTLERLADHVTDRGAHR